jgi:cytochrome P450
MPIFNERAKELMKILKEKEKENSFSDISRLCSSMSFDIIGETGFGYKFDSLSERNTEYLSNIKTIMNSFTSIPLIFLKSLYFKLPIQSIKNHLKVCERIDNWIHGMISFRRENQERSFSSNKDLLDRIIEAEKEENISLSLKEIHNNIFGLFFAGHG